MKGDFTRNTFDPEKNFTRVLMQQGRVLLDSDWNEQADIQQDYLRKLVVDLIGPHAGPVGPYGETEGYTGFSIKYEDNDLTIGFGSYYIDGIRCENLENGKKTTYYGLNKLNKNEYPLPGNKSLVYLDVWEKHVTYLEDDDLREVALEGPDTTTRSKVAWQVRVWPLTEDKRPDSLPEGLSFNDIDGSWNAWRSFLGNEPKGLLRAQAKVDAGTKKIEPCAISPEACYSGPENRLYRVEIHKGGSSSIATFKWSRENGSVVFPVKNIGIGKNGLIRAALEHLGHGDDRRELNEGDWVEFVSEEILLQTEVLQTESEPLMQVQKIEKANMVVYLKGGDSAMIQLGIFSKPLLRRWDHRADDAKTQLVDGTIPIEKDQKWFKLEDGIEIAFKAGNDYFYRTGDYWLIPARKATGDVLWPQSAGVPMYLKPHGVKHHYAPLMAKDESGNTTYWRRKIKQLWDPCG